MWFTGPASFTAQAARDRRALLARVDELEREAAYRDCKLRRAIHALKYIAEFWKLKPSGGYASSALEDIEL